MCALLVLSTLQLFIATRTYELGARQAHASCVQGAGHTDRSACRSLLPFWEREDAFGARDLGRWFSRTTDLAIDYARRHAEALQKMFERRRLRQALAPDPSPTRAGLAQRA
jgi:hypothetical protein